MKTIKELAGQTMEFLDSLPMPEGVRVAIVFVDTTTQDIGVASDLSDKDTIDLLQEGINITINPEGSEKMAKRVVN